VLGESPSVDEVHQEVEKVRLLFVKLSKKSIRTELGLWGELFCIAMSSDKSFLLKSWHKNSSDKFDFNDGRNLLEIKTTLKNIREHEFSYDQIRNERSDDLLILSIMTFETDFGKSVFDLYKIILDDLSNEDRISFTNKLFEIAGDELHNYERKFDLYQAQKMSKFYPPASIPSVEKNSISPLIKHIRFISNLENSECVDEALFYSNNFLSKTLLKRIP
jgi:hypothetical protein